MKRRGAFLFILLVTSFSQVGRAQEREPDDFELLQQVRIQFREGNYEAAEQLSSQIFESDPSMLVRAEAHQFLGASYELLGRSDEAEEQFEELLTLQPQFMIDQAEFPTEVVTLYETVRLRVQDRLRQIEDRRRRAQDQERRQRDLQQRQDQERLLRLQRPRYLIRENRPQHWIVTLMPFGAGQFQNGQSLKGYVFLGIEASLLVGSLALWLVANVHDPGNEGEQQSSWFEGLMHSSWGIAAAGLGAYLVGLIDAAIHYVRRSREPERWQEVAEEEVPVEFQIAPEGEEGENPPTGPGVGTEDR